MISAQRVRPTHTDVMTASAWEQVSNPELAFDFSLRSPAPSVTNPLLADWGLREKVGVKEAIIRWLEEQL